MTDAKCKFILAWQGHCNRESVGDSDRCEKHKDVKCCACKKPATMQCPDCSGSFVCGSPICDDCEHHGQGGHAPKVRARSCVRCQAEYRSGKFCRNCGAEMPKRLPPSTIPTT